MTVNPQGTVCTIPITFNPAYPGRRWVPLQAVTGAGNINFGLMGFGVGPLAALTPSLITTYAGNGTEGFGGDGGPASSAEFNFQENIVFDNAGNLYIADIQNNRVRKVAAGTNIVTTVAGNGTAGFAGDGGPATSAELNFPQCIAVDSSGNLYIADEFNNRIRKIDAITGIISTYAGTGNFSFSGDGGPATNADLARPIDLAFDNEGNLYISDLTNQRIRKIAAGSGIITTIAGNGTVGFSGDSGPATNAQLANPSGVAFDSNGNLYFADVLNSRIRKIDTAGILTTVVGNGTAGFSGDGGLATDAEINSAFRIAVDPANNLYITDTLDNRLREVSNQTGIINTIAGTGAAVFSGDNGAATAAGTWSPIGIAFDNVGGLYLSDSGDARIRKLDLSQSSLTYPTSTTVGTSDSTDNPQTVTVANIGNANLTIPPSVNGNNPSVAANFTFDAASTCEQLGSSSSPQILAVNADCTIAIDFDPLSAGAITGTAVLADSSLNSLGTTQTIHLNGTGLAASTTTAVVGSPNPSVFSETVTFTATVAPTTGTALPTGSVQFTLDGTSIGGPMTLNNGIASFNSSTLAVGSHTIAAVYTPDTTDFTASNGSTSQVVNKATPGQNGIPGVTLVSAPNPSTFQQSVTFTATVPIDATGKIQFLDGGTVLGVVNIVGTTATLTTSTLAVGTHPVKAIYGGDGNFSASGSVADNQVVNKVTLGQSSIALTSSLNPSIFQQSVTFTATVPNGATGKIQFLDGSTALGVVNIVGTTATLTTSTLAVGTHPVKAIYGGDENFSAGGSAADDQVVNKATLGQNGLANITLTSSPNPSTFSQSVIFTATVPSGLTGTVQFVDQSAAVLGTATISGTTATFTTIRLAVGTHPVTAIYSGDTNFNTATSAVDSQVVVGVPTSATVLTVSPASVEYGNPATLTAVVTPSFATGTMSFFEGSTLLGTASLDSTGTAVLSIGTLNAGTHSITAKYNGDPAVPANTSNTVQLTVTQRTAANGGPAITVTVNNATRTTSQSNPPFTYSPSGQLVNGDTYGNVISGTPNYETTAGSTPGTFSITVGGLTSTNYSIAFVPGMLTVTITPTTTTLTASPASSQYGDPVTLTASVPSGATGTVSFYDGSILLGTATVTTGTAALTTTTLTASTHTITAVYNGDATYASSQSDPATVNVAKKSGPNGGSALTVTIQNASREFGTADPQFNYAVTGSTLVNGDTYANSVTGVPTYLVADTATSSVGSTFPINENGLNSANYEIAVEPGTLTIVSAPTATTLAANTNATRYGDLVILAATVNPNVVTGTVLFTEGANVLGSGTVSGGVAMLTTSTLTAGAHTITATYEGDGNFGASTSGPITINVSARTGPNGEPALTVTVADENRLYGQGNPAFSYTVAGTLVNGDTYATAVTGVPVFSTMAVPASPTGGYPVSIIGGLNSSNYVIGFVNGMLTVAKDIPGQNGLANITLTSSPNPSIQGQPVTFTATVPDGLTGTMQFMQGSTTLGTATINGNTATFTTSTLPTGTNLVTAVYGGDANDTSAISAVDSQVVGNLDFTLTLTSTGSQTVIPGNAASYTVQVAATETAYPGPVTFSATGLPAGATISFSPATVSANGGTTPINVSIKTAPPQKAALKQVNTTSLALAILLLPFAASRKLRKRSGRYFVLLILLIGGIAATTGLIGCGYDANGFFDHVPQSYTITITATSGSVQHAVNVTLNEQ